MALKLWPVERLLYAALTQGRPPVSRELTQPVGDTPPMTREQIEAGLADGTLERGITRRHARGVGEVPAQGALLLPWEVRDVLPAVMGREVVGWITVGEARVTTGREIRWFVEVVAVGRRS